MASKVRFGNWVLITFNGTPLEASNPPSPTLLDLFSGAQVAGETLKDPTAAKVMTASEGGKNFTYVLFEV